MCDQTKSLVLLPGDSLPLANIDPEKTLKIGPGLEKMDESSIKAVKAGILRGSEKLKFWIDNSQKRYVPATGDVVIGIISGKGAENYKVNLGSAHAAILPVLAFEDATKRNRPHLEIGTLVYARVSMANKDMEPELECVNPTNGKSDGFGELKNGYMFECSSSLSRSLLFPSSPVLVSLGEYLPFELAVGLNGRVWVHSQSNRTTIAIVTALKNSETLKDTNEIRAMVKALVKSLEN